MGRIIVCVGLLAGLAAVGCAPVKPWQRGALAHRSMDPQSAFRTNSGQFGRHVWDVREGSTQAGAGNAGGGCGCN